VSFLVPESIQGPNDTPVDLDGNGTTSDIVVVVYTIPSATTQVLGAANLNGSFPGAVVPPGGLPPVLPTTFAGGTIVYEQVRESDVGRDLNGDGDMDDVVTLVDGDADGDGIFDSQDVCTETPNADQRDTDGAGLPDACDPNPYCGTVTPAAPPVAPAAPPLAPTDAAACQRAISAAIRKLFDVQGKATRGCLEKIARGRLAGDPTAVCRGGIANGVAVLPGDASTAAKIAKAAAKVAKTAMAKCADLTQLQACASDPASLAGCAQAAAADAASVLTDVGYGEVQPIVDPTALRCQRTIGKASGKLLSTVAKAMAGCLDRLNDAKLSGSADTLCLGAGTPGGITLPADPSTASKIQRAEDAMQAAIASACPGATAAGLHACGTDASTLADCFRCTHARAALGAIRAAYGPQ
jgi:hypothetical protein